MNKLLILEKEYNNYKTINKIIDLYNTDSKNIKYFENAIERFILARCQIYDPPYGFHPIDKTKEMFIIKILFKELNKKKDMYKFDIKKMINDILNIIQNNANINNSIKKSQTKPTINDNVIIYKDFIYKLNQKEIILLQKTNLINFIICLLRYKSILSKGQHCALPQSTYDILYNKYNFKVEGFSSPFNSKLNKYNDTYIGSLFYEIDKYFGSIGKFSLVNILDDKIKGNWMVNPPFISELLTETAEIILEGLDKLKFSRTFIFMMPYWDDNDGLIKLRKSKYHHKSIILPKFQSYIECDDKKIRTQSDTILIVVSNDSKFSIDDNLIINSAKY